MAMRPDPLDELQAFLQGQGQAPEAVAPSVHHNSELDFVSEPVVSPLQAASPYPPGHEPKPVSDGPGGLSAGPTQKPSLLSKVKGWFKRAEALEQPQHSLNWRGYGTPGKGLYYNDTGQVFTWPVSGPDRVPHHLDMHQEFRPDLRIKEQDFLRAGHVPFNISPLGRIDNSWEPDGVIHPNAIAGINQADSRLQVGDVNNEGGFGHARNILDSLDHYGMAWPNTLYHVSPASNRDSIQGEGLRAHEPDFPMANPTAWGQGIRGNYAFDTPHDAHAYATYRSGGTGQPHDVWEIGPAHGLPVEQDPEPWVMNEPYHPDEVQPDDFLTPGEMGGDDLQGEWYWMRDKPDHMSDEDFEREPSTVGSSPIRWRIPDHVRPELLRHHQTVEPEEYDALPENWAGGRDHPAVETWAPEAVSQVQFNDPGEFQQYYQRFTPKQANGSNWAPDPSAGNQRHVKVIRGVGQPDEYGDFDDHDEEWHELDPHDEEWSVPQQAADVLQDHGVTEPSAMPGWHKGLWYSHPDEYGTSAHLEGFTPEEEQEVWATLQARDYRHQIPDVAPQGHPDPLWDNEPGTLTFPEGWQRRSSDDELHYALEVPEHIKHRIKAWVDDQNWPEDTDFEDPDDYHITLLYAKDGHDEHHDADWLYETDGYDVKVVGIDEFGDEAKKAVVLRIKCDELLEHANDLLDAAENRGLDVSRFPGGYKPHLTVAYAFGKPPYARYPKLKFKTGPSATSEPREGSIQHSACGCIVPCTCPDKENTTGGWLRSGAHSDDPYMCRTCLKPTLAEPRPLQGDWRWLQTCTNCGRSTSISPTHPVVQAIKNAQPQYPAMLDEIAEPRPLGEWMASYEETAPNCPMCGTWMQWRDKSSLGGLWPQGAWECTNQRCWHMIPPGELAPDTVPNEMTNDWQPEGWNEETEHPLGPHTGAVRSWQKGQYGHGLLDSNDEVHVWNSEPERDDQIASLLDENPQARFLVNPAGGFLLQGGRKDRDGVMDYISQAHPDLWPMPQLQAGPGGLEDMGDGDQVL